MKNLLFLIVITLINFGCSSDSSDSSSDSVYNPPSWIQGTWGTRANGSTQVLNNYYYKFTSDNVCQLVLLTGDNALCWKDAIQQSPNTMSGNDTATDTNYEASLISSNGLSTITFRFQKVSPTKILWISNSSTSIELEKLN